MVHLLRAWRADRWVVLKDSVEMGSHEDEAAAVAHVAALARESGLSHASQCLYLVRDRDGSWRDEPCPGFASGPFTP